MSSFLIPQTLVLDSPVKPTPAQLRAVLAGVFNRDVVNSTDAAHNLSEAQAIVVMGSKLLFDLGFEQNHVQAIFRHFKDIIERWVELTREAIASYGGNKPLKLRPGPLMLSISDNTRATMVHDNTTRTRYYDFKKGEEITILTGVAPILQLAVNLSRLFESVVDTRQSDWYRQSVKEAVESGRRADQVSD